MRRCCDSDVPSNRLPTGTCSDRTGRRGGDPRLTALRVGRTGSVRKPRLSHCSKAVPAPGPGDLPRQASVHKKTVSGTGLAWRLRRFRHSSAWQGVLTGPNIIEDRTRLAGALALLASARSDGAAEGHGRGKRARVPRGAAPSTPEERQGLAVLAGPDPRHETRSRPAARHRGGALDRAVPSTSAISRFEAKRAWPTWTR